MNQAVVLQGIGKSYGAFKAVHDFTLSVAEGTIFGLLGPNGAGKTTLIRILTTLMRPTTGNAWVDNCHVVTEARQVRSLIGVVPQENNLDRYLTGRENLVLHARMHGMSAAVYNRKIDEILELTGLAGRQHDFPDTYSGGMQRRLVVARALVHTPRVLFLDEPTTGLDPQSRRAVWDYIQKLKQRMTIFLTTHYMEEADLLCDRIMIMDHGETLVDGTAAELKGHLAHARVYELEFRQEAERYEQTLRAAPFVISCERRGGTFQIVLESDDALKPLMDLIAAGDLRRICQKEPTLEEVFIHLTGRELRE